MSLEIIIHGDKIKITDSMRNYLEEKLNKITKYIKDEEATANVVVKVEKKNQKVEVTIRLNKYILRAEETKTDFYAAVDKVVDTLVKQIRKNKTRMMSKKTKSVTDFNIENIELPEEDETEHKVVKRKNIEVKPMNEEEAILQMELLGHEFYMYKDSETGKTAVVYRRKDGNFGIIEEE